jgi:hypothetical protein
LLLLLMLLMLLLMLLLLLLLLHLRIWMRAAETSYRHSPEVQLWKQEQEQGQEKEQEQGQVPKKTISLAAPLPCLLTPEHEQGQMKQHAVYENWPRRLNLRWTKVLLASACLKRMCARCYWQEHEQAGDCAQARQQVRALVNIPRHCRCRCAWALWSVLWGMQQRGALQVPEQRHLQSTQHAQQIEQQQAREPKLQHRLQSPVKL